MKDFVRRTLGPFGEKPRSRTLFPDDEYEFASAANSATPAGCRTMKFLCLAGFLGCIMSPLQAQERKEVTVTPLLSSSVTSSGQPIVLPQKDAQVDVSIYDIMPGATMPVHKHPYPMYAYVLSGNLRVTNMETGRSNTYKPGDFILESVGQWHTGASIDGEPVKLLVINIVERGQSNTVLQPHSPAFPEPAK